MIGNILETSWWYLDWKDRNSGMLGNVCNSLLKKNWFSWWEMKHIRPSSWPWGWWPGERVSFAWYGLLCWLRPCQACVALLPGSGHKQQLQQHGALTSVKAVCWQTGRSCCCTGLLSAHAATRTRTPAVSHCSTHAADCRRFDIYVNCEETSVGTFECIM